MAVKIHLFDSSNIPLDVLLNNLSLSNDDLKSLDKYKNISIKKEKALSLYFKNKYIGQYYLNEYGKPLSKDKYFNISHTHEVIVYVESEFPIGIDIEKIKDVDPLLVDHICNDIEKEYIKDNQSFYEIWTNKEAIVKALGTGIKRNIKDIISLPINGKRIYENNIYFNKTIKYDDYIITVSRQYKEDYDLEILKEVI